MNKSVIDDLHSAMEQNPSSGESRLDFYLSMVSHDFLIVLEDDNFSNELKPRVFELEQGNFVLCFDDHEKLSTFFNKEITYVIISFKTIIDFLREKKVGIAINLGKPSGVLLDLAAIKWMDQILFDTEEQELTAMPIKIEFPHLIDEKFLLNLKRIIPKIAGFVTKIVLAKAYYGSLNSSYILAFINSPKLFRAEIKDKVSDTIKLNSVNDLAVDITFLDSSTKLANELCLHGMEIEIPALEKKMENHAINLKKEVPKLR